MFKYPCVALTDARKDTLKHKSVYVLGIEEKSMLVTPPDPTVLEAISENVFGILSP
jgi:hypothetical protein